MGDGVGVVGEDVVGGALAQLRAAVDAVLGEGVGVDGSSVRGLWREVTRLEAAVARQAAGFDDGAEWRAAGAEKSPCWVAAKQRCPLHVARRPLRLGAAVRHMPKTVAAWEAGEIGADHVEVLAQARGGRRVAAFDRDEAMLVGFATELPFRKFLNEIDYWRQLVEPDEAEERAKAQREERSVHSSRSFQGLWFGNWTLDPIGGDIVDRELRRLDQQLFAADWADAKARLGREPSMLDLARTPAQRRADALVEMATRSRIAPADGRRPEPLFTVLVDHPTLAGRVCELASGVVVTPGSLLPWLDAARVERVVFGPDRRVIRVGKTDRFFRGGLRRAIQVRDRGCTHELCDRAGDDCQVDHVVPYTEGGPTTQDNGRLLCGFHNRDRNDAGDDGKTDPVFDGEEEQED